MFIRTLVTGMAKSQIKSGILDRSIFRTFGLKPFDPNYNFLFDPPFPSSPFKHFHGRIRAKNPAHHVDPSPHLSSLSSSCSTTTTLLALKFQVAQVAKLSFVAHFSVCPFPI